MTPKKLTDSQLVLLSAAAQRADGAVERTGNRKGAVAKKVITNLLNDGLVEEVPAGDVKLRRRWRGASWPVYCWGDRPALFLHRVCLPASARRPASVILTRATSTVHPPTTTRSAFARGPTICST
jgi:hypothetical protein